MLARWQTTITDGEGNVVPFAQVQVRREVAGLPLAQLYADDAGATPLANPVTADADGYVYFHVEGWTSGYRIRAFTAGFERIWYNVPIGSAAYVDTDQLGIGTTTDAKVETLADLADHDDAAEGFAVFVADVGDGRAAIYFKLSGDSADWSGPGYVTGPAGVGRGLTFDVVVADLSERAVYDGEAEGFAALVNDSGDGRAAVYVKLSNTSADWSGPNYLVGDRFDLSVFVADFPYSGELVLRHVFTNSVGFAAAFVGSVGKAEVGATGTAVFTVKKNGVEVGTVTFDESDEAAFALAGGAVFDTGDVLEVVAPSPQDETLFNVAITLAGIRSPAS